MDERRPFLQRRLRIEDRGQFFIVDLNKLQGILGLLQRLRRHRRDALTDKSNAVLGENGNIAVTPPVKNPAHVVSGKHRAHARRFLGA